MSIKDYDIKSNDQVIVKGEILFSKLFKAYTPGEIKEKKLKQQYIPDKPYREVTIINPEITKGKDSGLGKYLINDRLYERNNGEQAFSFQSISKFPPKFYVELKGQKLKEIHPKAEFAHLQKIKIVIHTFKTNYSDNPIGLGLHAVIFENDPIYFKEQGDSMIENLGYKLVKPSSSSEDREISSGDKIFETEDFISADFDDEIE